MKVFISGATGFIGSNLAIKLAKEGHVIHALYRSEKKVKKLDHPNIKPFKGDILDKDSLLNAMEGCEQVYHLAAFTSMIGVYRAEAYHLNYVGTVNVLEVALQLQIPDIVFSSSAGVIGPVKKGVLTENSKRCKGYFLEYEATKALAEDAVHKYNTKGLKVRIVNPTRVYGPGLFTETDGATEFIRDYLFGVWKIVPGDGNLIVNYAYIDDVIQGHILAMKNGIAGERYLLGGENVTYNHFFKLIKPVPHKTYNVPYAVMLLVSFIFLARFRLFKKYPMIIPGVVRKFYYNWNVSSDKAITQLGYSITPLSDGLGALVKCIKSTQV